MTVRTILTLPATGDTVDEVVDYYYRYLARNSDLTVLFGQFKKRLHIDPQAATAEAIVFSLLRAEKLHPELFEDPVSGGPDFRCNPNAPFLVEVTSLDSAVVSKRSGLPASISGPGGGAFGQITDRLLSEAKNKAPQLGRYPLPGVLAITSDHAFSSILLDRLAAEYLMTSAPQFNVPLGGGPHYMTTDLKHAVFYRPARRSRCFRYADHHAVSAEHRGHPVDRDLSPRSPGCGAASPRSRLSVQPSLATEGSVCAV